MGSLRRSKNFLIRSYLFAFLVSLRHTYGSEHTGVQQELLSSSVPHSKEGVAAERVSAPLSQGTVGNIHAANIPESLDAKKAPKGTKSNKQRITRSAETLEAQSRRNDTRNGVASSRIVNNRNLVTGTHKPSVSGERHVRSLTERTRTPQSSPHDDSLQSSHDSRWHYHRRERMNRHSEFVNSVATYAKRLRSRARTAGNEVIELLSTLEGLSQEHAALLLKLLRTWPDIKELLKRYEKAQIQPQEQLLSSLVQYRARATDLATRPRPRIYASRAVHAYVHVGEPLFHDVIAAFLFAIVLNEPTRLRNCREYYLPMLQVSLSVSALMLHHVPGRHTRDCLEVIERRIVQLEHLGRIARAVQDTWRKLALSEVVNAI